MIRPADQVTTDPGITWYLRSRCVVQLPLGDPGDPSDPTFQVKLAQPSRTLGLTVDTIAPAALAQISSVMESFMGAQSRQADAGELPVTTLWVDGLSLAANMSVVDNSTAAIG